MQHIWEKVLKLAEHRSQGTKSIFRLGGGQCLKLHLFGKLGVCVCVCGGGGACVCVFVYVDPKAIIGN